MKNLENFGVQGLSAKEIRKTEGGGWLAAILIIGIVIGLSELSKNKKC